MSQLFVPYSFSWLARSSRSKMFYKKGVRKNCAKLAKNNNKTKKLY